MKKEPRYLSEEEYRRLLRACSHHARDAAVIEVFLQTGMRLSELAGLTLPDLELPTRITRDGARKNLREWATRRVVSPGLRRSTA